MKKLFVPFISMCMIVLCLSCDLFKTDDPAKLGGDQSAMGEVGVTVSSSSAEIAGISNCTATVTSLENGVSSYSGSATVKNVLLRNLVANIPGITIEGNKVTATNMEFKLTDEGFECKTGPGAGVMVKYSSSVGDTYPIGSTGNVRTVVSNTGIDEFPYGFMLIKVIKVEETPSYLKSTAAGVTKVTYIANHKYGLVGVEVAFDDGTTAEFPIYTSTEN